MTRSRGISCPRMRLRQEGFRAMMPSQRSDVRVKGMNRMRRFFQTIPTAASLLICAGPSTAQELWFEDNNMATGAGMAPDFKKQFMQPDTWKEARRHMDVYFMRANTLMARKNDITDDFLRRHFVPVLRRSRIAIALDVQGGTWMSASKQQSGTVKREIELIRKLRKYGGDVRYLSLQSVLSKPLRAKGKTKPYPMEQRYKDIQLYMTLVKREFPRIKIGIVCALPTHNKDYRKAYKGLKDHLAKSRLAIDHIDLDVPCEYPDKKGNGMSWRKVKEVEDYVRKEIGCEFGLICTSREAGYKSDEAYHNAVMSTLPSYAKVGGSPDRYLIMSWFPHPKTSIPDTATGASYPVMRTVLEFGRKLETMKAGKRK